jgi:hypothetical protein
MSKSTKVLLTAILVFLGISALAAGSVPFSFKAGEPIKADEVNANFQALAEGKQNTITNSPCGDGQFVTGIDGNGKLSCGVDQIGSAGSSGVSSLNGKTGSLAIEGGDGVTVETTEDGKVTISAAVSTGGDLSPQATIAIPSSGAGNRAGAAFKITNNNTTTSSIAIEAVTKGQFAVLATGGRTGVHATGTNTGVTGIGSGTSSSSKGVVGESYAAGGIGVFGQQLGSSGYGVYGNVGNGIGVYGKSATTGVGVGGVSSTGIGVQGQITSSNAGNLSAAVSGINNGNTGIGVRGEHKGLGYGVYGTAPQVGVGGQSANIGVRGIGPIAMSAQGNAVQTLGSFGWAKAMVHVRGGSILRCYNSQATSYALMQGNGCGFTTSGFGTFSGYANEGTINFGFNVTSTFPMLTMGHECDGDESSRNCAGHVQIVAPNSIKVFTSDLDDDWTAGQEFFLILF